MPDDLLTIGELAKRTGVATSALRYWEDLGLLTPPVRVSGQRRYPPSAVGQIGAILLMRDAGFTLRDLKALLTPSPPPGDSRQEILRRKLIELDERIAQAQAARTAVAHGLSCPHENILDCPHFTAGVAARLAGASFEEAHQH
ncbi:MerR family transcriptional regulator [Actinomadura sp. KC06]|uniref:MerR family transcriptional regulator n=1 Tax=Actinomadura sp. KC06 TaxID=2530369 RepID=UPI00104325DB|nr:MerR family transcriptional regulator [Actinomadura sp. KC06]TDD26379.1 MerR family transcriptional regulator [Actinomadura sp. KC06]